VASAVALVLAACGTSAHRAGAPHVTTTTSTAPPTTTTTTPPGLPVGTLAVGTRTDAYVDTSRPTPPNGGAPGAPTRTMPTTIWYPATGPATAAPAAGAPPDVAQGPFPLVVFAHGFAVVPATYAALLARWASAGYVVVAPAIPLLNGDAPGGASHGDYAQNNVTDLDFVLGQALQHAATPGDPLAGLIDPSRVAVTGHSDGEVLAYDLGFEPCCHDPRVKAVIAMAGNLGNAGVLPAATGVPILHVMEDHDQYDPYPASIAFDRANLQAPKEMLTLVSAVHLPPYSDPTDPHFNVVVAATVDFLDATLKGRPDGLAALQALVAGAPTLATLEGSPPTAPTTTSTP
jgi:dienelactone hydrolase